MRYDVQHERRVIKSDEMQHPTHLLSSRLDVISWSHSPSS